MIVLMGLSPFVLLFIGTMFGSDRDIRRAEKSQEEWYKNNPYIPPTEEELQESQNLFDQEVAWQEHLAKNSPKEKFLRDWKA